MHGGRGMATVLIVEDQAQILALAKSLLEEEGHKIFIAPNVDEALVILTGPEPVDALLVDIILNRDMQAGIELAKRAVALKPGLKVVYSTGLTLTDHVKALLLPGAVILEKPYTLDQLLTSLMAPRIRD
jgi:DNA-binding NtrC family response regulator